MVDVARIAWSSSHVRPTASRPRGADPCPPLVDARRPEPESRPHRPRQHRAQRGPAHDPVDLHRERLGAAVDGRCLRPGVRRAAAHDGRPRRPVRSRPRPPGRTGHLRCLVADGPIRHRHRPPHRRPRRDGRRRGVDHALDPVGHRQRLPARGARQGHHDLGRRVRPRHRPRPARGWPAHRELRVERGVPPQRPDRAHRARAWLRARPRELRSVGRAARPAGRGPLDRGRVDARVLDHRGAGYRLDRSAHPWRLRRGDPARCGLRLARDPHAGADARPQPVPEPALHGRGARHRTDLLRDVRGHLRTDPVPAVRPRSDRARGGNPDARAGVRHPDRRADQPQGGRTRRDEQGHGRGPRAS